MITDINCMIKIYIKQAWRLIRQERLFSFVYIIGTGLAITLVMLLSIVFYVKIAPVYPESNRDRTLVLRYGKVNHEGGGYSSSCISNRLIQDVIMPTDGLEAVAMTRDRESTFIQMESSPSQLPTVRMAVNDGFWKVFSFRFLEGKPFDEADVKAALPVVVISDQLAHRLFGEQEAVGKMLSVNFEEFRVVGVVEEASYLHDRVYSQIWYPYTYDKDWEASEISNEERNPGLGWFYCYPLVEDGLSVEKERERLRQRLTVYGNSLGDDREFSTCGAPDLHWESIFRYHSGVELDIAGEITRYAIIFFFLLLVPAVSLSGLADSRMERRLAELGVRRAFGARKGVLISQVLVENLLYTLLGGVAGLLFSFIAAEFAKPWIFKIGSGFIDAIPDGVDVSLPLDGLFNPIVFALALLVCFLLNLMSALMPALRASSRPITDSLNS